MYLHDFEALFHLCVAFNFIYATVDKFSEKLEMFFAEPFKNFGRAELIEVSTKVQALKDGEVIKNPEINTAEFEEKLDKVFIGTTHKIRNLFNPSQYDQEYGLKFKSTYLLMGLFSLFLLIISGLHHYCDENKLYQSLFLVELVFSSTLAFVIVSTFRRNLGRIPAWTILVIFMFTMSLFIFSYIYPKYVFFINAEEPSKYLIIFFAITLILLPFFLHFIRITIQAIYARISLYWLTYNYRNTFQTIESEVNLISFAQEILDKYKHPNNKTDPEK